MTESVIQPEPFPSNSTIVQFKYIIYVTFIKNCFSFWVWIKCTIYCSCITFIIMRSFRYLFFYLFIYLFIYFQPQMFAFSNVFGSWLYFWSFQRFFYFCFSKWLILFFRLIASVIFSFNLVASDSNFFLLMFHWIRAVACSKSNSSIIVLEYEVFEFFDFRFL